MCYPCWDGGFPAGQQGQAGTVSCLNLLQAPSSACAANAAEAGALLAVGTLHPAAAQGWSSHELISLVGQILAPEVRKPKGEKEGRAHGGG